MRMLSKLLMFSLPCLMFGQQWEFGGSAGYGLPRNINVTSGTLSGKTGFDRGVAFGAVFGNEINDIVGGEARYTYRMGDLKVSSGSTKATMGAEAHAIHYDVLVHAAGKESPVRPFLALGGGVKFYRGTGREQAFQPLTNLVILTHTSEAQPLISAGGGVKFSVSRRALLRFDFRDYMTPLPTNLFATPPNTRLSGWVHDFVFLVGVSTVF